MALTQIQTAESFSRGDFSKTYPFLAEDMEWNVINNFRCKGRTEVMEQCEKIAAYFSSVTTHFNQMDVIESRNKVVIIGSAEFSKNGERLEFVDACDVYEFDDQNMLHRVTSYCIVEKE